MRLKRRYSVIVTSRRSYHGQTHLFITSCQAGRGRRPASARRFYEASEDELDLRGGTRAHVDSGRAARLLRSCVYCMSAAAQQILYDAGGDGLSLQWPAAREERVPTRPTSRDRQAAVDVAALRSLKIQERP
ncbi:hypothetical protein L227DRAFT_104832 [Lentinus tigrinus ALCF2SS1-6]|uniref:Uncharacterized protein n=1 Tax=Lentinus tigrinus ALCF2SS1-6 TaxID=1328759 RepID=A0A5C2S8H6_9APHY|nr:hypothetical protein L227DRAFT_104832 [Lentinus tigrinus ALCF2SS1-6]